MHEDDDTPARDPEGVRIIGADEAAEALERPDVARRREPGEPRPGDRPGPPPADTPEPVLRFPLSSGASEGGDLPHWTEPPTSAPAENDRLFDDEPAQVADEGDWASFTTATPRWRDSEDAWEDDEDVSVFGDDDTRVGALDESDRDPEDYFRFDEIDEGGGRSVFDDEFEVEGNADHAEATDFDDYDGPYDEEPEDPRRPIVVGGGRVRPGAPGGNRPPREPADTGGVGGDRNIGQAAAVGLGVFAVAAICFIVGPALAAVLVTVVVTVAAAELFTRFTSVGFQPANLLGVAATAGTAIGAYHRGESAVAVGVFLTFVVAMLWFLVGAGNDRPATNVGVTLAGYVWVGVFGSFATMILGIGAPGTGILMGAIVATVGYDVGGYFVGRSAGSTPLSEASPNKTIEGLLGGCIAAVTVAVIYGFLFEPFGTLGDGLKLGLAVAVVAPLGDLCQSMIKRDLGIKDMGTLLPGHGGAMDRFDALLFVLPTVYFVAKLSDFFV